jgi:RNA polymerase sigma factor (sigma-70 family)
VPIDARRSGSTDVDEGAEDGLSEQGTMQGVLDTGETARLQTSLVYLARRQYRITREVAEDLVQSALLTYLEVKHRYPRTEEHLRILVGIFRNKCREHIGHSVRTARKLDQLRTSVDSDGHRAVRGGSTKEEGVLEDIVNREEGRLILQALGRLRPQAREMFRLIAEDKLSRKELMARFDVNANTLDSRLHTYRKEFRKLLVRQGFVG